MKRRPIKGTTRPKADPIPTAPYAGPMSVILVDGTRIRREIKADYEKVVRDLAKAREDLDRFQQLDVPRFSRWLNSTFGALLTELRETSRRIQECDYKLLEMEREVIFMGVSPGRAYRRVMEREREAEKANTSGGEQEGARDERSSADRDANGYDSNPFEHAEDYTPPRRKQAPKRELGARIKELYRALVRRLHPDMHRKSSVKRMEWWHQAQNAYEKGDEEQLEVLLTLCEIEEAGTVEKASLSVLQKITRQFKRTLRQIRKQLEGSRKDPAWKFSVRKDVTVLAASMKSQLTRELEALRAELFMLEEQLAGWAAQAKRSRLPVYRRRRVPDPFDSIF